MPDAGLPAALKAIPTSSAPSPLAALDALTTVVQVARDYGRIREEEQTRRHQISSQERSALTRIAAQRELLLAYLDRSFDERSETFRRLFDVLDGSLRTGAGAVVSQTLQSIVELARSGPLAELADFAKVQKQLNDPNHTWKI